MNSINQVLDFFAASVAGLDPEKLLLSILLLSCLVVLQRLISSLDTKRGESGLARRAAAVSVDGSKTLPVRDYISDIQGLAGRPDAVISENGFLIPVERKPLARKLRDRYVAQLLVYMRLIEEFEGKKPPYGYLILGTNCRKIRIDNTPERQAWLQNILDQMREILAGAEAKPLPHPKKCRKCDMREHCQFASSSQHSSNLQLPAHGDLVRFPKRSTPIQ